ncbi:hypothetical protein ACFQY0_07090 [Haloferula chungangensis]|uniref:Ribbon-helix-helix protein, CopG family n=1 Tax=Haloferula chungangensis TaxID=1048331 RepID=A0ABW2L3M9_9BACT
MQTTLRLPDEIYRAAKTKAAEEGITLTRFLEEGLKLRIEAANTKPHFVPKLRSIKPRRKIGHEDFLKLAEEVQLEDDLKQLGASANSKGRK